MMRLIVPDKVTGMTAAQAILAAVVQRRLDGGRGEAESTQMLRDW